MRHKVDKSRSENIRMVVYVLSGFLLLGIFGGVERGTIADWKLIPAMLLIAIIDLAVAALTSERI